MLSNRKNTEITVANPCSFGRSEVNHTLTTLIASIESEPRRENASAIIRAAKYDIQNGLERARAALSWSKACAANGPKASSPIYREPANVQLQTSGVF